MREMRGESRGERNSNKVGERKREKRVRWFRDSGTQIEERYR